MKTFFCSYLSPECNWKKQDCYRPGNADVLQELVSVYLNEQPDSFAAVNLRACNMFRLMNDHTATVC